MCVKRLQNILPHNVPGQFVRTCNRGVYGLETRLAQAQSLVCCLLEGKLLCKRKFGGKAPRPSEEEAKVETHCKCVDVFCERVKVLCEKTWTWLN